MCCPHKTAFLALLVEIGCLQQRVVPLIKPMDKSNEDVVCELYKGPPLFDVTVGPMFSGKSQQLIEQVRRFEKNTEHINQPVSWDVVLVLKCSPGYKDKTPKECTISSRNGTWCDGFMVGPNINFEEMELHERHVIIDEAQFLTPEQVEQLGNRVDCRISTYGLLADVYKCPFPGAAALVARADRMFFLKATCAKCFEQSGVHNHLRTDVVNFINLRDVEKKPVNKSADGKPFVCENDDSKYSVLCSACDKKLKRKQSKKRGRDDDKLWLW